MGVRLGTWSKNDWGRSIPEILPSVNGRLFRLHGFTPSEIMLGYAPEWKVTHGKAQKVMPGNTHGVMQEVTRGEVEEMEEGPEGLNIERMIAPGMNKGLLRSDQFRKTISDTKEKREQSGPNLELEI